MSEPKRKFDTPAFWTREGTVVAISAIICIGSWRTYSVGGIILGIGFLFAGSVSNYVWTRYQSDV